jgi:uncharacterized membrane protein YhaH (DUF805 family)
VVFAVTLALCLLQLIVLGPGIDFRHSPALAVLSGVCSLVLFIFQVSAWVRRFHDFDKTGWLLAWAVVPIVGFVFLVWAFARTGTAGRNHFGFGVDPGLFD